MDYSVNINQFNDPRPLGVSGYIRCHNDEDYLAAVIESVIVGLDEVIIILQQCTDSTADIAIKYKRLYPNKIKIYYYDLEIYPAGSKEHLSMATEDPHGLANYSNWCLSKITYSHAVKIDPDDLMYVPWFNKICNRIRNGELGPYEYWPFNGVNLWDKDDYIYVCMNHWGLKDYCGYHDRGFHKVCSRAYYGLQEFHEVMFFHGAKWIDLGFLYFHLKHLKSKRGLDRYLTEKDRESPYNLHTYNLLKAPLYTWKEFQQSRMEWLGNVSDPNNLNISLIKRTQKDIDYLKHIKQVTKKNVIINIREERLKRIKELTEITSPAELRFKVIEQSKKLINRAYYYKPLFVASSDIINYDLMV